MCVFKALSYKEYQDLVEPNGATFVPAFPLLSVPPSSHIDVIGIKTLKRTLCTKNIRQLKLSKPEAESDVSVNLVLEF